MKKALIFILSLLFIFAIVFFGSPYYKLYTLKNAYDKGDYQPIIAAVDFEVLRPNLKHQLYPKVDGVINNHQIVGVLKMVGVKQPTLKNFGIRFVDMAIDRAITADNMHKLAQGQIDKDSEPLIAGVALMGGFVNIEKLVQDYLQTGDFNKAINKQKVSIAKEFAMHTAVSTKPELAYCGINCFTIKTSVKTYPIQVVLSRHHIIDWKIDNVILP